MMLGTHAGGRPCSGFQNLDEFVILDLLVLELAHAATCLDAIDGIHIFFRVECCIVL